MPLSFLLDDFSVHVNGLSPDHEAFLREFFSPYIAVGGKDVQCGWSINFHVLEEPGGKSTGMSRSPTDVIDLFSLDGDFVKGDVLERSSGRIVVTERSSGSILAFDCAAKSIRVTTPADTIPFRVASMRVIRELFTACLLWNGRLHVHASGVVSASGGVLFIGPSGQGKTSLLIFALRAAGTSLLTNDRVFLDQQGKSLYAQGMPTFVSVNPDTLDRFPHLSDGDWARHTEQVGDSTNNRRHRRRESRSVERLLMLPSEFCAVAERPVRARAKVSMLVFPEISSRTAMISETLLSVDEATDLLAQNLINGGGVSSIPRVFRDCIPGGDPAVDNRILEYCEGAVSTLPSWRIEVGPSAYESLSPEEFVRQLNGRP